MIRLSLSAVLIVLAMAMSALADDRPNVLFCFSDDWGRYASIYRDPQRPGLNDVINTPALDAIGRSGVVFNNAFVQCTELHAKSRSGCHWNAVLPLRQQRISALRGVWQSA